MSKQTEPTANWNEDLSSAFIDIVINEINESGQADSGGFKSNQWNRMVEAFYYKTGTLHSSNQLQNKYKTLKGHWVIWNDLSLNSGFGWDEGTQLFTSSDSVWETYLASHPKASQFRKKTLFRAKDLTKLFR
jgi:hypothetical protein